LSLTFFTLSFISPICNSATNTFFNSWKLLNQFSNSSLESLQNQSPLLNWQIEAPSHRPQLNNISSSVFFSNKLFPTLDSDPRYFGWYWKVGAGRLASIQQKRLLQKDQEFFHFALGRNLQPHKDNLLGDIGFRGFFELSLSSLHSFLKTKDHHFIAQQLDKHSKKNEFIFSIQSAAHYSSNLNSLLTQKSSRLHMVISPSLHWKSPQDLLCAQLTMAFIMKKKDFDLKLKFMHQHSLFGYIEDFNSILNIYSESQVVPGVKYYFNEKSSLSADLHFKYQNASHNIFKPKKRNQFLAAPELSIHFNKSF